MYLTNNNCFFPSQLRMFHLIEFLINKTLAVVPQNWCSDGVVSWPNYKNDERVNRAVKHSESLDLTGKHMMSELLNHVVCFKKRSIVSKYQNICNWEKIS